MKGSTFYRIASVFLVLFALGHTVGFTQAPGSRQASSTSSRRCWRGSARARPTMTTAWAFVLAFAAVTVVSAMYLFVIPIAFSLAITICLTAAAWQTRPAVP